MIDFGRTRALFDLPAGIVYLDGNSLGPVAKGVAERVGRTIAGEWGRHLIGGWTEAGWMEAPGRLGDRIGRLIGAPPGQVVLGDTLSVRLYQALGAALALNPDRRIVLTDSGNFPSDLYIAAGLLRTLGPDYRLEVVDSEDVSGRIDADVAVLMLTEVDYRTGRRHDMADLTARARAAGALTLWDLAHSAGAVPVDLAGTGADFAVGCTYKFLNGGPGAPAFVYAAARHADRAETLIQGWLGHAEPFAFERDYRPAAGSRRMRIGTPPVLQMAALDAALDVWDGVEVAEVYREAQRLGTILIDEVLATCPELELASPHDPVRRGSQISFRFAHGYAAIQALIGEGVVGDFRAPDIMRFGITPLYVGEDELRRAAALIGKVVRDRLWERAEHRRKKAVT